MTGGEKSYEYFGYLEGGNTVPGKPGKVEILDPKKWVRNQSCFIAEIATQRNYTSKSSALPSALCGSGCKYIGGRHLLSTLEGSVYLGGGQGAQPRGKILDTGQLQRKMGDGSCSHGREPVTLPSCEQWQLGTCWERCVVQNMGIANPFAWRGSKSWLGDFFGFCHVPFLNALSHLSCITQFLGPHFVTFWVEM